MFKPHLTTRTAKTVQGRKSALRIRRPASVAAVTVTCASLAVLAVGSSALASNRATSGQIKACYQAGTTLPPLDHIATAGSCPAGDLSLTWNKVGPKGPQGVPGPAGISAGVQAFSNTQVGFNASTWMKVVQTPNVPTTGDYYVSASLQTTIDSGDGVGCYVAGSNNSSYLPLVTVPGTQTISVVADVQATAGSPITVFCTDLNADSATHFSQGDANAILISNDVAANVTHQAARAPSLPRRPAVPSAK